jgi:hypothetical protein
MDPSLRQIVMLIKVTAIALSSAPIFLFFSALFARHDQIPASVETTSHAPPQSAIANANSTTPRFKVASVSTRLSSSEMVRPELTLSLLNLKKSGMAASPANEMTLFASSSSAKVSQRAVTVPGLEPAVEVIVKPATKSANSAPTELRAEVASSQAYSTDAEVPRAPKTASEDGHYDLAWPDQWRAPRSATNEKQNLIAKVEKKRTPHIHLAQKERKSSASTGKKDLSGAEDDPNSAPRLFQPNIEDGSN